MLKPLLCATRIALFIKPAQPHSQKADLSGSSSLVNHLSSSMHYSFLLTYVTLNLRVL
jgi:hypothetical protein